MAKQKVTITLDRAKADAAAELLGVDSTSKVIDAALERFIKTERLRRDIEAYRLMPETEEEMRLAHTNAMPDLPDDIDWEAVFPSDAGK